MKTNLAICNLGVAYPDFIFIFSATANAERPLT